MGFVASFIAALADSLALLMLGYLAIVIYQLYPPENRKASNPGLVLKLAGLLLFGIGLFLAFAAHQILPHFPASPMRATLTSFHDIFSWPLMVAGFLLFSLGLVKLLRVINPERFKRLESELQFHKSLETDMATRSKGLELLFRDRSSKLERTEKEIRLAHSIVSMTLENMDQGILMVDGQQRIVIYNQKMLELLGKEKARVDACVNLEDFFRIGEVDDSAVERAMLEASSGDKAYYELYTRTGKILGVRQNPLQEGGWVRTYTDITAYKNVEAALRQAKVLAESTSRIMEITLENLGHGILMADSEGRIVTYNNKFLEYLGLDKTEVANCQFIEQLIRLGHVHEFYKEQSRALAQSKKSGSFEFIHQDRILEVRQNVLREGGWVRSYTNITRRKKIEEELQNARLEAEASTLAKAAFLATMSHEIRTPMNGIIGMVELMSQSSLQDDQQQIVQTIRDSGQALLTILDDILDLSKIESGKLQLEQVEMSVRDTVENAAATLAAFAVRNKILLVTWVDAAIQDRVYGDPVRIRQIMFNLLSNAIKFSGKGSEVLVRVSAVTTAGSPGRQTLCFSVIDHGIGMDKKAQATIFGTFNQAETSTTRRYGGTGLGLSICKRLTDMMQGKLTYHTETGVGTTFNLELEFKPVPVVRTSDLVARKLLSGLHLVVVCENTTQSQAASHYLEHAGAAVLATTALANLPALCQNAAVQGRQPDVIVLLDTNRVEGLRRICARMHETLQALPALVVAHGAGHIVDRSDQLQREVLVEINPLRRDNLIRAVAVASRRLRAEVAETFELQDSKDVSVPGVEEALEQGKLILVAEDNVINQDVIRRQLHRLGYQCEITANGVEALELWRRKAYAVVLTDCHMPDMDGFELTQAIRNEEKRTPRKRTPIIAITANALQGEAEHCLASGMDAYLAKPLKLKNLQDALQTWLSSGPALKQPQSAVLVSTFQRYQHNLVSERESAGAVQDRQPAEPVVDRKVLQDEFGDNPALLKEIMQEFLNSASTDLEELEQACLQHVSAQLVSAAHKMKSGCLTIGANPMAALCARLELAGKVEDWVTIDRTAPLLRPGFAAIVEYVAAL